MQNPGQQCGEGGQDKPPGTGIVLTEAMLLSRFFRGTCHSVLSLRLNSNAVFCFGGEFLCFRKPWASLDVVAGCQSRL